MPESWSGTGCPDRPYVYPPYLHSQDLTLTTQVPRHVCVDVFEHSGDTGGLARQQRTVAFSLFLRSDDFRFILLLGGLMLFLWPVSDADQVFFRAIDRVAQGEAGPIVSRPVFGGVV